jgi:hypothetical protein
LSLLVVAGWQACTHRTTPEKVYGLSRYPPLADASRAARTVATGYSCRSQAELVDGLRLMHPLQLLLRALNAASAPSRPHVTLDATLAAEHREEV